MSKNELPLPCEGCKFSSGAQVNDANSSQPRFFIVTDGILLSEPAECGSAVRKVAEAEQLMDFPDLAERLEGCPGAIIEEVEVPRGWLFGAMGLTKVIEVRGCGATNAQDIGEIVAAVQEKSRLESIYGE